MSSFLRKRYVRNKLFKVFVDIVVDYIMFVPLQRISQNQSVSLFPKLTNSILVPVTGSKMNMA